MTNKISILYLEDEKIIFDAFREVLAKDFSVYPKEHDKSIFSDEYSLKKYIKETILRNDINLLIIDLNLNNTPAADVEETKNQLGVKIMEYIYDQKNRPRAIYTLPSIIISNYSIAISQTYAPITSMVFHYAWKEDTGTIADEFEEYLADHRLKNTIRQQVDAYIEDNNLNEEIKIRTKDSIEFKTIVELKNELYQAIEKDNIVANFQAIVDSDNNLEKYEVLARVRKGKNDITFYHYLKAAKKYHLLHDVTKIIIQKSFNLLKEEANKGVELSINLDRHDLLNDKFEKFHKYIEKERNYKFNSSQITFEILEGIEENHNLLDNVAKLVELGYKIAIDDFGIEHSNMKRLKDFLFYKNKNNRIFPIINYLKIDAAFIKNVVEYEDNLIFYNENAAEFDKALVKMMIELLKGTGVKTIIEHVHNQEVFKIFKEIEGSNKIKIDYYQGYAIHKPNKKLNYSILNNNMKKSV